MKTDNFYKVAFSMKRMKRVLLIGLSFIFIFLLTYNVNASHTLCLNDDQIIIRLYGANNTHAANATTASALEKICYDDIFGPRYTLPDPNSCDGNNLVINLTASENAHAGDKTAVGHGVGICYGDLSCFVLGAGTCNGVVQKEVLALSSTSNAHLAINSTYAPTYPYVLCCSMGLAGGNIIDAYWADINNNKIPAGAIKEVNRTVQLIVETSGLINGEQIIFSIYENDSLDSDNIRTNIQGSVNANKANVSWFITDNDINKGIEQFDDEDRNQDILEFYFEASGFGISSKTSNILLVNKTMARNNPPIAKICKPEHREMYFVDREISFEDCSTDNSAIVSTIWRISEDGASNTSRYFNHTFITAGQKTITLGVTDDDGAYSEAQIAILLLNKTHDLLAFINKPYHQQIVNTSLLQGVEFSANDSYVVNNSIKDCNGVISCLAGNCPAKTMNPPPDSFFPVPSCTNNITLSGSVNIGFTLLYFNWTFSDGYNFGGLNRFSSTKYFSSFSQRKNDKWIKLLLQYEQQGIFLNKITNRSFTFVGNDERCLARDGIFLERIPGGGFREVPIDIGGCVGDDGEADGDIGIGKRDDDCCPGAILCKSGKGLGGTAGCDYGSPPTPTLTCGAYKNQVSCEDDLSRAGENPFNREREESPVCGSIINACSRVQCLGCVWIKNLTSQGCYLNKTTAPEPECVGSCDATCAVSGTFDTLSADENGYCNFDTRKIFNPGNSCAPALSAEIQSQCTSSQNRVLCVKNALQLPFFGFEQIAPALGLIIIVYLIMLKCTSFMSRNLRKLHTKA